MLSQHSILPPLHPLVPPDLQLQLCVPELPPGGRGFIFPVTVSPVGIHERWVTFQPRRLPWAVPPHLPSAPLWTQSSCPKPSYSHSIGPGDANSTQVRGNVGTTEMQSKRCPWHLLVMEGGEGARPVRARCPEPAQPPGSALQKRSTKSSVILGVVMAQRAMNPACLCQP